MAWDDITRQDHRRVCARYPSDMTDREWAIIAPLLLPARSGRRPRTVDLRAVMDAILFVASSGCQSWIMMRSATDLGKADLHVFSKLFDDGLERGQEAEAFSWRQIGGHDDVLEFLVGHLINVEMTRQPAS